MLDMRLIILNSLILTLIMACSESPEQSEAVHIPYPESQVDLDPSINQLLKRTRASVQKSIDDPQVWLRHGSALYANSLYDKAAIAFEHAISIKADMPQATYLLASAYWKKNEQTKGIQTLQQALSLMPEYDIGWRLLAEWHQNRGETDLALIAAKKAFGLNPNRIGARYVLAQTMMDDGKFAEAIPLLEEVIQSNNAPRWIYNLAFQCYRQEGMSKKAKECSGFAGPPPLDWPDPMFKHIPNLIAGKAELAEYAMHFNNTTSQPRPNPYLNKALRNIPEQENVRVALSITLEKEGLLNEAKQLLIDFQGEPNINYWKQFAGICISLNALEEAKGYIDKAMILDVEDGNAHEIAAVIAEKRGNELEACLFWQSAGKLFLKRNRFDKAQTMLESAEKQCEVTSEVLEGLAIAQIENNSLMKAERTLWVEAIFL